jgi:hypothetical protein
MPILTLKFLYCVRERLTGIDLTSEWGIVSQMMRGDILD